VKGDISVIKSTEITLQPQCQLMRSSYIEAEQRQMLVQRGSPD